MTRTYSSAIADTNWHTIWDLIVAAIGGTFDPLFANTPFVPSQVNNLQLQSTVAGMTISGAGNAVGQTLATNGMMTLSSPVNSIDLKSIYVKGNGATAGIMISYI